VLRIEDTDRERSTPENVKAILDGLAWLGLDADEGPFRQTERFPRYQEIVDRWLHEGKAYYCYCSKETLDRLRAEQRQRGEKTRYDGRCRNGVASRKSVAPVVRFKNPLDGDVIVEDQVHGQVVFANRELDDLIIARPDGSPTYNFSVIIDDYDMRITHVIRGDDHLNNTPRQINMLRALGAEPPVYAHLPMILGPDGAKLSKRHGAMDIREYESQGYLPEAILNYLVRLGWSHGDQEIFSVEEMISLFDIVGVNQSASSFNPEKLLWINQQHIIATPAEQLGGKLRSFLVRAGLDPSAGPDPVHIAEGFHERAVTLLHMAASARYCYEDFESIDEKSAKKHLRPIILEPLLAARNRLAGLEHWGQTAIHEVIADVAADFDISMGKLGQPIRVAVTSGPVSPPIDVTLWLVGQARTIRRLDYAIRLIEAKAGASGD